MTDERKATVKRWHVVSEWQRYQEGLEAHLNSEWTKKNAPTPEQQTVWTVSIDPESCGWETDSGCLGYGLTRAQAEELANAANAMASPPTTNGELWAAAAVIRSAGYEIVPQKPSAIMLARGGPGAAEVWNRMLAAMKEPQA